MGMSDRLRQLRENIRYTQREVAEALGLSTSALGMYEAGKRDPDTDTLSALAKYYDVSADYLLGHTDVATPLTDQEDKQDGLTAKRKTELTRRLSSAGYSQSDIDIVLGILDRLALNKQ